MTKKSDLELFKQALTEGMSLRFQSEIGECADDIAVSDRHVRAVESILNGARIRPIIWPSARAKIAAAIIAAVMILTGCAARYGDEIREFIETIYEEYARISFSDDESRGGMNEIYEPSYIPEGYALKDFQSMDALVYYSFADDSGNTIEFCQWVLDGSRFQFDIEKDGYSEYIYVDEYKIYHRKNIKKDCYLWNDGKYALQITSDVELSAEELGKIINGITIEE